MRSAVGQQWSAALKADLSLAAAYKTVGKGYSAQRIFRAKWAKQEYTALKETREQSDEIKTSIGQYGCHTTTNTVARGTNTKLSQPL